MSIRTSAETGAQPGQLTAENAARRLTIRANVLARIREYFSQHQVTEVETPLLSHYPVTDPQLDNLRVDHPFGSINDNNSSLYLTTSPEYAMKQLLSMGSGSIYQLAKAFRQDSPGRLHSIEFTLLEWYRIDFDMDALIDDVAALVNFILTGQSLAPLAIEKISYRDAFINAIDIDPHTASAAQLENIAKQHIDISFTGQDKDTWLDLLLTHCVEPQLGKNTMTFLYDYPETQAALARLGKDPHGNAVAKRFELYINAIELANGYHELCNGKEQLARFERDNQQREAMGKPRCDIDTDFIAALNRGVPDCAGVALGVDRLLLVLSQLRVSQGGTTTV